MTAFELICENRVTFDAWLNRQPVRLPAPLVVERPHGVFVTVADPDDLSLWMEIAGGVAVAVPVDDDWVVWHLTVDLGEDCRGLMVQVAVVAHRTAQPMHSLLESARLVLPLAAKQVAA